MKKYNRCLVVPAIAAAALSFALVACDDDSTSAKDETPISLSENDDVPLSSAMEEIPASSESNNQSDLWLPPFPDMPCADTLMIDGHYFRGIDVLYKCEDNKWSYVDEKDIPPDTEMPFASLENYKAIWKLNKCTAENEGAVQSEWDGNPKYGAMCYYRCEGGSWVQGDITLTCDTAGVQVGDTCVTHPSINIFQAGMNPDVGELVFVYKGDGVWERTDQAQIDSLMERQNRLDAAIKEYCGEPDPEKLSECCYPVPEEFAADYPDDVVSVLYEYIYNHWGFREYFRNSNCVRDAEEEVIEE